MRTKLFSIFEAIRSSFWFVPACMTVLAAIVSVIAIRVDHVVSAKVVEKIGWIYAGGPEGARAVLAAIAGSMITVAGVVFSITVVMLSVASQQFGPRLLRTFIRDHSNQVVLGAFVSTFVYCLLVLRTVRGSDSYTFVPYLSVTFGIVLAVLSIGVLIFFVHHAAESIQSSSIIAAVGRELDALIDSLYPETIGADAAVQDGPAPVSFEFGRSVESGVTGYVQFVDGDELLDLAGRHNCLISVRANPGAFVRRNDCIAEVHFDEDPGDALFRSVHQAFAIGEQRTAAQDLDFLFRQLTEIAVRALSPGINDPFTAIECVDRLTAALTSLAGRRIPSKYRRDRSGQVRVIAEPVNFAAVARLSLGSIRRYASSSSEVLLGILHGVRRIAPCVRRDEDRDQLVEEVQGVQSATGRLSDETAGRLVRHEAEALLALLISNRLRDRSDSEGDQDK